jgi:predicted RNase H-like nuclease (RuvC/YqgF family)
MEIQTLLSDNQRLQISDGASKDYYQQVKELTEERNDLERRLRDLSTSPFYKKNEGENHYKQISDLKKEVADKDKRLNNINERMKKHNEEVDNLKASLKTITIERDTLKNENEKIRAHFETDGSLNIMDV